jgi:hypothetical protein
MIDLNKVSEGVDYNIVPDMEEDHVWAVEILRGDYADTGFIFDQVDLTQETGKVSFKLTAISLRDGSPLDSTNRELQLFAGDVLEDIIKNGIARGEIELDGKDSDQ